MKVLLINPNTYRTPPVPPLALLQIQASAKAHGHDCTILDLCFSDNPEKETAAAIELMKPDIAGVTIRNIDTVLFDNNVFFLDDIKNIVRIISEKGIPVVLGGAGYSFIPEGILQYLEADYGIKGPGENAFPALLKMLETNPLEHGTTFDGFSYGINDESKIDISQIDYIKYTQNRGIPGFETQKGCFGTCTYCGENRTRWMPRNPDKVVSEICDFSNAGFDKFHLCDTEFNQNLNFSKTFLKALIDKGPSIKWALYMKSEPFDEEYFRLLKESGANLVTLSLPTGTNWEKNAGIICRLAKENGIKIAVDFLTGFPGDTENSIKRDIDTLRKIGADTVGVNSMIRLHPEIEITREILMDKESGEYISGSLENNPYLIHPVFYIKFTAQKLREIIGNDPLFKIEGFEATSNYERL